MLQQLESAYSSWNSLDTVNKPPTPPGVEQNDQYQPRSVGVSMSATANTGNGWSEWNDQPVTKMESLEQRRLATIREREREQAARKRHQLLMAQKREQEIKRMEAFGRAKVDSEEKRAERLMAEATALETRRGESLQAIEEKEKRLADENRKRGQIEERREAALQALEMNRIREDETRRIQREAVLKKRAEMERVRDATERLYQQQAHEANRRKVDMVEEMRKRRSERLADLERRRTNPVLLQQEREFNQLIELNAALGRLYVKMEQTQAQREDVRERLIESRHLTEVLELEENQLSLSMSEVEADVRKLEAYQTSLEKLVSTRYDEDECGAAVTKIQSLFRGSKDRADCAKRRQLREQGRQKEAAVLIQKTHRGVHARRDLHEKQRHNQLVSCSVKIQAMVRGSQVRSKAVVWKRAVAKAMIEAERRMLCGKGSVIQCAFRSFLARRELRRRLVDKIQKARDDEVLKPYLAKRGGRYAPARAAPKGRSERKNVVRQTVPKGQPSRPIQRGEMSRIYVSDDRRHGGVVPQPQTRFSAMGSLVSHRPHYDALHPRPPVIRSYDDSPYTRSPRHKQIPKYPTAAVAEVEPQKLFNYLPVMDSGWGGKQPSWKLEPGEYRPPKGIPIAAGARLPEQSMLIKIS